MAVVKIRVTENTPPNTREFSISINPEPLELKNEPDAADIDWQLQGPGWSFVAPRGIEILSPGNAFQQGPHGNTSHRWKRLARESGKPYKYAVRIQKTLPDGTVIALSIDPVIVNN
jgi:hypothetical protein